MRWVNEEGIVNSSRFASVAKSCSRLASETICAGVDVEANVSCVAGIR